MPRTTDPLAERLERYPTWQVAALATGTVTMALLAIVSLSSLTAATAAWSPLPLGLHRTAVGLPIVIGLYAVGLRYGLRAPAAWFLAGRPTRQVLVWAGIGLGFPSAVLALLLVVLDPTLSVPTRPVSDRLALVVTSIAAGLLAGVLEELAFRGGLLRILEARWGARIALGVSTVVFAGLHQGHATTAEELALAVTTMTAAGLLLGLVALRTRSVWNAVAVHAGWNTVFGGNLLAFGLQESAVRPAIVQARIVEPSVWFTGIHGSPGSAPATTVALLFAAVVVHRWVGRGPVVGRRSPGRVLGEEFE